MENILKSGIAMGRISDLSAWKAGAGIENARGAKDSE